MHCGCVARDIILLKRWVLSWIKLCSCSMRLNVGDWTKINSTWRLKTDYYNAVDHKCLRCPKHFFSNTVFYYTTPIRGSSAHWIITLFVGKSLIVEAQNHKITNKSAEQTRNTTVLETQNIQWSARSMYGAGTQPHLQPLRHLQPARVSQHSPWLGDDCSSCSLRRMLPPLEGRWWWCFFLFFMRIFPSSSCGEGSGCPGSSWSQTEDVKGELSGWWHFGTGKKKRAQGFSKTEMACMVRAGVWIDLSW